MRHITRLLGKNNTSETLDISMALGSDSSGSSYQLTDKEQQKFRKRYRYYLENYHDCRNRGAIHLREDMMSRLEKYAKTEREMVKINLMNIWKMMTHGMEECIEEVSVDQAVENYMSLLHSPNEQVRQNGRAVLATVASNFFKQLDVDGDGMISLEDWMEHYSLWNGTGLEVCKQTFSCIDLSGVGFLCINDVVEAIQGFFCKASQQYYDNIFGPLEESSQ